MGLYLLVGVNRWVLTVAPILLLWQDTASGYSDLIYNIFLHVYFSSVVTPN